MKLRLPSPSRRELLGGGLGLLAAAPASALARAGTVAAADGAAGDANVADAPRSTHTQDRVASRGIHQAGVTTPRPSAGMIASFYVLAETIDDLERLFRILTARIGFLTLGGLQRDDDPLMPPAGSGILGPVVQPDALTVTVSLGASLFNDELGLSALRPVHLQQMQAHANDALDAALCHGDLSIQFCANTPDTNIHALRDIIKNTSDLLVLHWK
ncbi:Dyp-type peroxidase domain-containing protein [Novosphingobium resinovorum]|uniref:Dyp-type peroxidase domain-containing protein n=1 Tax=Novosphingobium resinovorum TaxID=158500 RepID=UPI002ED5ABA0|nr:Dyp-type peroxidase domain-containing protein [Novosphingobium resinovorum]